MSDVMPPQLTDDRAVELVTAYLGAWAERRGPVRRRLLHHCWAESATFSSWTTYVKGFDAMDAHIGSALRMQPRRCRRVRTSEVHSRNGKVSFTWAVYDEDENIVLEGSEFAEVGDEGRFERVTSFAGRPGGDAESETEPEPSTSEL